MDAPAPIAPPPIAAVRLDLAYAPAEDRLALTVVGDGGRAAVFALTRRLTRLLAGRLVRILMDSSAEVGRAAAAHREDVLLFEHLAVTAPGQGAAAPAPAAPPLPAGIPSAGLLVRIDFQGGPAGLSLRLFGADGTEATLVLGREQIHRMLGVLAAKAREAEWDFGELAWFDRAAQVVVPAGTLLS
jgi:hypothetical protein